MLFSDARVERALQLWSEETLRVSSRLTALECATVIHRYAQKLPAVVREKEVKKCFDWLSGVLGRLVIYEIDREVGNLIKAESKFGKCRTLDAIHLATATIFAANSAELKVATFDDRMRVVAVDCGLQVEN